MSAEATTQPTRPGNGLPASRRPPAGLLAAALLAFVCGATLGTCSAGPQPPDSGGDSGLDGGTDAGSDGGIPGSDGGLPARGACTVLDARRCELLARCGLIASTEAAMRSCISFFTATWCGPTKWL